MEPHYIYVELAFAKLLKGSTEGFLYQGDHHQILEEKYKEGYRYVGWVPFTFSGGNHAIETVELIFEKME